MRYEPAAWLLATLLCTACGTEIGSSCSTNVDCSPIGDRICDTSQRDGYCTVEGCGIDSCPDEAECIRFFPSAFLSVPCDPRTEDAVDPSIVATNDCTGDEICLAGGYCAMRTQERRFCMKRCDSNGDCRSGYECRETGTAGAEAVPDPARPGIRQLRFCAQQI